MAAEYISGYSLGMTLKRRKDYEVKIMKFAIVAINLITYFMGNSIHYPITIPDNHAIYPSAMLVEDTVVYDMDTETVEDDEGLIIMTDSNGNEWVYEMYPEDYFVGDYVCTIMDDNGTPGYVYDDIIIDMRYSGYYVSN